jgi:hypothetical protein
MGRILSTHGLSLTGSAGFKFNTLNYSFVIERAVNIHITVRPTTSRRRLHQRKNWRSRTSSCCTIIDSNSLAWARVAVMTRNGGGLNDIMDCMARADRSLTELMVLTELIIHFATRYWSDRACTTLRQVPSDLDFYSEHMKCKYAYWRIKLQSSL